MSKHTHLPLPLSWIDSGLCPPNFPSLLPFTESRLPAATFCILAPEATLRRQIRIGCHGRWKTSFGEAINCIQFRDEGRNKFLFSKDWEKEKRRKAGRKPPDNLVTFFFLAIFFWKFIFYVMFSFLFKIHEIIMLSCLRLLFCVFIGSEINHFCLGWHFCISTQMRFESAAAFGENKLIRADLAYTPFLSLLFFTSSSSSLLPFSCSCFFCSLHSSIPNKLSKNPNLSYQRAFGKVWESLP